MNSVEKDIEEFEKNVKSIDDLRVDIDKMCSELKNMLNETQSIDEIKNELNVSFENLYNSIKKIDDIANSLEGTISEKISLTNDEISALKDELKDSFVSVNGTLNENFNSTNNEITVFKDELNKILDKYNNDLSSKYSEIKKNFLFVKIVLVALLILVIVNLFI